MAKKKIHDKELIKNLAAIMCTLEEISSVTGQTVNTLKTKFGKAIEEGRSEGKRSLRRAQFEKALGGDTRMLIFLGKNICGQTDNGTDNADNQPLPWEESD